MQSTESKNESQRLIDMMVNEEDARRADAKPTRNASFHTAQQNKQSAQGISGAMKLGFALSVATVVLTWMVTR